MQKPLGPYTPVVQAGGWVIVSGQVGAVDGVLAEGVAGQTAQAIQNLSAQLATAGATLADVKKTLCFLTDMDDFGADDAASMAANNTSAFNCRGIDGRPGAWSEHSYGWAIDVNPVQNPWVRGSQVDPPSGAPYVDRTLQTPGMVHADDGVVQAFRSIGWAWGGYFRNAKDYQHFSATGR